METSIANPSVVKSGFGATNAGFGNSAVSAGTGFASAQSTGFAGAKTAGKLVQFNGNVNVF